MNAFPPPAEDAVLSGLVDGVESGLDVEHRITHGTGGPAKDASDGLEEGVLFPIEVYMEIVKGWKQEKASQQANRPGIAIIRISGTASAFALCVVPCARGRLRPLVLAFASCVVPCAPCLCQAVARCS